MIVAYLEIINIFRIKKGDYMFKENDIVMFIKKEPFSSVPKKSIICILSIFRAIINNPYYSISLPPKEHVSF